MQTIPELLAHVPALAALTPAHRDTIAGCARNRVFEADEMILREGRPADTFHVIRAGAVALETYVPRRGPVIVETLHDGDLLGWSWLVPPYRVAFDGRAVATTHTIEFDGACLRGKCDADPALGYELLKLVATVIVERLQETRMRLLDVYGKSPGDGVGAG
jgi:signal-transduction protein with cAMP-binding, CBS, and nucleotidyltransferase domain